MYASPSYGLYFDGSYAIHRTLTNMSSRLLRTFSSATFATPHDPDTTRRKRPASGTNCNLLTKPLLYSQKTGTASTTAKHAPVLNSKCWNWTHQSILVKAWLAM